MINGDAPHQMLMSERALKSSVFGSLSEKRLFSSLKSNWESKGFQLYPSLPFSNLVNLEKLTLKQKEKDFLYKTSIDYTLCKDGNPLMSIDFDGLGDGFNRNGVYIQRRVFKEDPYRKLKFDLKIDILTKEGYPYYIVSYEESFSLGSEIHLAIIDGIIGQVLAKKWFHKVIDDRVKDEEEHLMSLPESEIDDYIQDLVWSTEIEAELMWNPVVQLSAEYELKALDLNIIKGWSYTPMSYPELPHKNMLRDFYELPPELFKKHIDEQFIAMINQTKVGCQFEINSKYGVISETCWMNNITGVGFTAISIVEEIAKLLAYKKLFSISENAQ